jgi:hypothetical protein
LVVIRAALNDQRDFQTFFSAISLHHSPKTRIHAANVVNKMQAVAACVANISGPHDRLANRVGMEDSEEPAARAADDIPRQVRRFHAELEMPSSVALIFDEDQKNPSSSVSREQTANLRLVFLLGGICTSGEPSPLVVW